MRKHKNYRRSKPIYRFLCVFFFSHLFCVLFSDFCDCPIRWFSVHMLTHIRFVSFRSFVTYISFNLLNLFTFLGFFSIIFALFLFIHKIRSHLAIDRHSDTRFLCDFLNVKSAKWFSSLKQHENGYKSIEIMKQKSLAEENYEIFRRGEQWKWFQWSKLLTFWPKYFSWILGKCPMVPIHAIDTMWHLFLPETKVSHAIFSRRNRLVVSTKQQQ